MKTTLTTIFLLISISMFGQKNLAHKVFNAAVKQIEIGIEKKNISDSIKAANVVPEVEIKDFYKVNGRQMRIEGLCSAVRNLETVSFGLGVGFDYNQMHADVIWGFGVWDGSTENEHSGGGSVIVDFGYNFQISEKLVVTTKVGMSFLTSMESFYDPGVKGSGSWNYNYTYYHSNYYWSDYSTYTSVCNITYNVGIDFKYLITDKYFITIGTGLRNPLNFGFGFNL